MVYDRFSVTLLRDITSEKKHFELLRDVRWIGTNDLDYVLHAEIALPKNAEDLKTSFVCEYRKQLEGALTSLAVGLEVIGDILLRC